jgi:hypothetical protein
MKCTIELWIALITDHKYEGQSFVYTYKSNSTSKMQIHGTGTFT